MHTKKQTHAHLDSQTRRAHLQTTVFVVEFGSESLFAWTVPDRLVFDLEVRVEGLLFQMKSDKLAPELPKNGIVWTNEM